MHTEIKETIFKNWKAIAIGIAVAIAILFVLLFFRSLIEAIGAVFTWIGSWFAYNRNKREIAEVEDASKKERQDLEKTVEAVEKKLEEKTKQADKISETLAKPSDDPDQDKQDILAMMDGIEKGEL